MVVCDSHCGSCCRGDVGAGAGGGRGGHCQNMLP